MPKKAPKNAFYYFMQDFKEEQRKNGTNYGNLAEVAKAADPAWRNAPPQTKAHWEAVAKEEKQRHKVPIAKFTSTGIPLSVIEQQQREVQDAVEFEKQDIKNMINAKAVNQSILEEDFYVMDVNSYCKADSEYVIGESTVLRFNLRKGFRDFYHVNINPGRIPVGYAFDVKQGAQELGLDMPDESSGKSNYIQILAHLIDYLKQSDKNMKTLPPLYTMPDKVAPVQDFILQLCSKAGEDEFLFRVYKLDTLFFTLINAIKTHKNEGFPKESLALLQLKKDPFMYTPKLGCEHHEEAEKSVECTTSRTKRWAYTILDSCCVVVGIDIKPGLHVPSGYDIDGILTYKDHKQERARPTIAGFGAASSCDTSVNDSFEGFNTSGSSRPPPKRVSKHVPMRMPETDYSLKFRPPELTEDEFPALSSGAGRGRGLARSFDRMNMGK